MTESDLTSCIIEAIRAMGHLAWRNAQYRRGARHGGLGPGSPDVIACVRGRFVGLEVKLPKGTPVTDEQLAWLARLEERGGFGVVVRSVDEAVMAVRVSEAQCSLAARLQDAQRSQIQHSALTHQPQEQGSCRKHVKSKETDTCAGSKRAKVGR